MHTESFSGQVLQAFSWTLIHSLWQGMLLALLAVLLLSIRRNLSSLLRYRLVLFCFAIFVFSAVGTFLWYWNTGAETDAVIHVGTYGDLAWVQIDSSILLKAVAHLSGNAPTVVLIWFVFFSLRLMKFIRGLNYMHTMRIRAKQPESEYWQQRVKQLSACLGLNRMVSILESHLTKVPLVLGHFSPVILMPVGLFSGLPAGQLEAVLLHELAHIRRNDFLVNFLQTLAETVFFFNPGLVWISDLLRQEREHCCDDFAITKTGKPKEFIEALLSFKDYALSAPDHAVAFRGRRSQLLDRVNRLLGLKPQRVPQGGYTFVALSGIVLIGLLGTTLTVAQISPSPGNSPPVPDALTKIVRPSPKITISGIVKVKRPKKMAKIIASDFPHKTADTSQMITPDQERDEINRRKAEAERIKIE